jgi:hypothetical protein
MCLRVLFLSFFMKICFSLFKRIAMHLFFNPGIKHFFAMASMEGIDGTMPILQLPHTQKKLVQNKNTRVKSREPLHNRRNNHCVTAFFIDKIKRRVDKNRHFEYSLVYYK